MNHVNMTNKGRSSAFKTPMPFRKLTSDLLYTDGKRTVATIPRSHSKDLKFEVKKASKATILESSFVNNRIRIHTGPDGPSLHSSSKKFKRRPVSVAEENEIEA